jgi:hypothetical protein
LDEFLHRIGTLEIQIKTLPEDFFERPRWSYERPFMAACERTVDPTLLIAVNNRDNIAYWQHISIELLTKFSMECRGESLVIEFPGGNIINGQDETYLTAWQAMTEAALDDKFTSASAKDRIRELEIQVNELTQKTDVASLPSEVVKEIHLFLNSYNGIFEHDFKAIRDVLYSDFWKIGTVIGTYGNITLTHLLLPARFSDNSPLIRQFKELPNNDFTELFLNEGAIALSFHNKENPIKVRPIQYAYEWIEKDVMSVIEKNHFSIDDPFTACEYIVGFIDTFSNYLGMESSADRYNLIELLDLLDKTIPAFESTALSYREGMTTWMCHIDSYQNRSLRRSNFAGLKQMKEQLTNGFRPPLQIELTSSIFNLVLLRHYIQFLRGTKQEFAYRQLKPYQGAIGVGKRSWQAWDRQAIIENLKILFTAFPRLYTALLQKHFPALKEVLALRELADLDIFTVRYPEHSLYSPVVEKYELKASEVNYQKRQMFFPENDSNWPISRSESTGQLNLQPTIDGRNFEITRFATSPADFFESPFPASLLVHQALKDALDSYFKTMKQTHRK